MAKKPAPKKKANSTKPAPAAKKVAAKPAAKASAKSAVKAAAAKAVKPATKPVVKPIAKASSKVTAKAEASAKPAMMSKKSKQSEPEIEEEVEETQPVKGKSVVSMFESETSLDEPVKAEKTSKVKPVKIERGNLADEKVKWAELYKKYGKDKAIQYKMSEKFSTMIPMQHKVLGWGFILTNENDRLEVLFETGIRMLISNYKT